MFVLIQIEFHFLNTYFSVRTRIRLCDTLESHVLHKCIFWTFSHKEEIYHISVRSVNRKLLWFAHCFIHVTWEMRPQYTTEIWVIQVKEKIFFFFLTCMTAYYQRKQEPKEKWLKWTDIRKWKNHSSEFKWIHEIA